MGVYNLWGIAGDWGNTITVPYYYDPGGSVVFNPGGDYAQGTGLGPIGGEYGPLVNPTAAPTGATMRYSTGTGFTTRSPTPFYTPGGQINEAGPMQQTGGATPAPTAAPTPNVEKITVTAPAEAPMGWGTNYTSPWDTAATFGTTAGGSPGLTMGPTAGPTPGVEMKTVTATPTPNPTQTPNPTASPTPFQTPNTQQQPQGRPSGGGGSSGGGGQSGGGQAPQQPQRQTGGQQQPIYIRNIYNPPATYGAAGNAAGGSPGGSPGYQAGGSPAGGAPGGGLLSSLFGGGNSNLLLAVLFGGVLIYAATEGSK